MRISEKQFKFFFSKETKVSLLRLNFLVIREVYLRDYRYLLYYSKDSLATAIKRPYSQYKTTSLGPGVMLRDVIAQHLRECRTVSSAAASYRINNARRDPLIRLNRIWNLRSRPDVHCKISSDGLDPITNFSVTIKNQEITICAFNCLYLMVFIEICICI